eukprot:TRINITY_DN896_c11_g1_i1.p1 TRINITY_DN896_c11_g1~~TRINITY_DN896_c11_g1_i1.p1  ORF type:complete len:205 (+),score=31.06 TRINITY_DN896_c11_g1_i1:115-729(+)
MRGNRVPVIRFREPSSADTDHGGDIMLQGYSHGKCIYSKNNVLRQPFAVAEYNSYYGYLMFPEIDKSLNIPRDARLLQEVAELFNQYSVEHNIAGPWMDRYIDLGDHSFDLIGAGAPHHQQQQHHQFDKHMLSGVNGGRQPPPPLPPPSPPPEPPSEPPVDVVGLPALTPDDSQNDVDEEFLVPEEYELMSKIPRIQRPRDLVW